MVGGDGTATGEKRSTSGAFRPKTLGTQVLNDRRHRPLKVSTTPACTNACESTGSVYMHDCSASAEPALPTLNFLEAPLLGATTLRPNLEQSDTLLTVSNAA